MVAIGPVAILLLLIVIAVVLVIVNSASKASNESRPRGFPWISMFVGIVVLAGIATFIVVQSRPITYLLDVTVPAGKGFIGEVIVDGRREIIEDIGSKQFEFTGRAIRWRVLIDDDAGTESIAVQLTGGSGGSSSSNWGAAGFAEKRFFGGGGMYTSIDEVEWRTLMRELKPEANEAGDSLLPGLAAPSNPAERDEAEDSSRVEGSEPDGSKSDPEQPTSMTPEVNSVSFSFA